MFFERISPTSLLDELLANAILKKDLGVLHSVESEVARDISRHMGVDSCRAEEVFLLGRRLADQGLVAAAAATFTEALTLSSHSPATRVAIHAAAAHLKRGVGMQFSAAAHMRAARRLEGKDNSQETLPELDAGSLMVLSAFNDADGHRDRLEQLPIPVLRDDPLRDPGFTKRHFLARDQGDIAAEDYSFFVIDGETGAPVLLVECDALGDRFLGCREGGVELTEILPGTSGLEAARSLALKQLDLIIAWAGCPYGMLDIPADSPPPASIITHLGNPKDWSVILMHLGWIDLAQDIAAIEAGYNAATRRKVRWGRKNIRVVRHDELDTDIPSLYAEIMGKSNRTGGLEGAEMAQALENRDICAQVGFYEDEPSAMVLASRHGDTAYYMAGARIHHQHVSSTHILIHAAIERAKTDGLRRFHFGPLYEGGEFGAKLQSIAFFKRGFATSFERRLLVSMPPGY